MSREVIEETIQAEDKNENVGGIHTREGKVAFHVGHLGWLEMEPETAITMAFTCLASILAIRNPEVAKANMENAIANIDRYKAKA